jgi:hypothetical protein
VEIARRRMERTARDPTLELNPMAETSPRSDDSVVHSPEAVEEPVDAVASEAHVTVDTADEDLDAMAKFQKATTLPENRKANADHATAIVLSVQHAAEDSDAEAAAEVSVAVKAAAAVASAVVAAHVALAHLAVVIMTPKRTKPTHKNTNFSSNFTLKAFFFI